MPTTSMTSISNSNNNSNSNTATNTNTNTNNSTHVAANAIAPTSVTSSSSFEEVSVSNWSMVENGSSDSSSATTVHEIWTDFVPDFEVPDLCSFDIQELQRREAALLSQVDWDTYDEISPYSSTECINACSTESSSDDEEMDSPITAKPSSSSYSCTSVSMSAISCSGLSSIPIPIVTTSHTTYLPSPEASPMEITAPSTPCPSIEASLKRTRSPAKRTTSFSSASDDEDQPEQPMDYEDEDEDEDEDDEEEVVKPRRSRKRQAKMLTPPSTGSEEDSPVSSPSSGGVRKVSHNEMERKRRGELRMEFQRLRTQLPKLASEKAPKITILNEANIYLDSLQSKISSNKTSLTKLLKERDNLRRQLEQVRGR